MFKTSTPLQFNQLISFFYMAVVTFFVTPLYSSEPSPCVAALSQKSLESFKSYCQSLDKEQITLCGHATHQVLKGLQESGEDLSNSKALVILNSNYELLRPNNALDVFHAGEWKTPVWGFHVIAEHQGYILDSHEQSSSLDGSHPLRTSDYFKAMFGAEWEKNLDELVVVSVPALTYLDRMDDRLDEGTETTPVYVQLFEPPRGWLLSFIPDVFFKDLDTDQPTLSMVRGEPLYFALSHEYRSQNTAVTLREYLGLPERTNLDF